MRKALRQTVRVRYDFRCGYCGMTETNMGAEMTIDHFQPRAHGGTDDLDNLVYCCHPCNEFKGEYWQAEPDSRLLHPLFDNAVEHYREQDDGTLLALTERGANHIQVIHLNRVKQIARRLEQQEIAATRARCRNLEGIVAELQQRENKNRRRLNRRRRNLNP